MCMFNHILKRAELQSKDTKHFLDACKQALFEEALLERVHYLYHSKFVSLHQGVPLRWLVSRKTNMLKMGILKNEEEFNDRISYLITNHLKTDEQICMHELPFSPSNLNPNGKSRTLCSWQFHPWEQVSGI